MIRINRSYNDEELVSLIKLGDHKAFEILVHKYTTISYQTAFRITKSKQEAEDVVQECFLKFWQNPHHFDSNKNVKFTTWFGKVVSNKALDYFKKRQEQAISDDFDVIDIAKNQLELIEEEQTKLKIEQAISSLNDRQKQALKLSYFENKKNHESAKIMGLSLKAFQSLLIRSKESLRFTIDKITLKNEKNF